MAEPSNERDLVRLAKLDELRSAGIDPYPPRLDRPRTHSTAAASRPSSRPRPAKATPRVQVSVAGRMLSRRIMGKVGFAHIEDGSGRLQIFVRKDVVGDEVYDLLFKTPAGPGRFHRGQRA